MAQEYLDEQRDILLAGLTNIYRKDADSNNYKLLDAIASELSDFKEKAIYIRDNVLTATQSTTSFLDEWGYDVDIYRSEYEEDDSLRQRIITSWWKPSIISEELLDIVNTYSPSAYPPTVEEWIKDRFWLGTIVTEPRVTLTTVTDGTTAVTVPYFVEGWTYPTVYSIGDPDHTGTNYASGCSYIYHYYPIDTVNATSIVLGTETPYANFPVEVTITPTTSSSGEILDYYKMGFLGPQSWWRYNQTHNTKSKVTDLSGATKTTLKIRGLTDYKITTYYADTNNQICYVWENYSDVNNDGKIELSDSKRVDNTTTEHHFAVDTRHIVTVYPIARIISIKYGTDDYVDGATFQNNTIYLSRDLPNPKAKIEIVYVPYPIQNYNELNILNFIPTGQLDPKYRAQINFYVRFVKWGEGYLYGDGTKWGGVLGNSATLVANLLKAARTAGISLELLLFNCGSTIYGVPTSIYGLVRYRGTC